MPNKEKEMTFLEHLEEMRGVILRCVLTFFATLICVLIFFSYFNSLMLYPLNSAKKILAMWSAPAPEDIKADDQKLGPVFLVGTDKDKDGNFIKQGPFFIVPTQDGIVLKPNSEVDNAWYKAIKLRAMSFATPLVVWFYVGLLGSIGFSLPIMLYFIARFVAPGLKPEELRMLRPGMIAGVILFAVGTLFAFAFILPMGIAFMSYMSENMGLEMFPDAQSYYSMVIFVTLAIGITFEMPLVEVILIYLGVLNTDWLRKNRKIVFFGILLFATVITPPDVLTQVSITIPLYLMYEVALVIGIRMRKKKLKQEALDELRQQEEDAIERKEYAQTIAKERLEEAAAEKAEDEETTKALEGLQIDKSTYGESSHELDNTYDNYPYDPYNIDDENYDPDNDPYAVDPYIDYGRASRYAPQFSPDWELNRKDTSFMSPDWSLNESEENAPINETADIQSATNSEETNVADAVSESSAEKEKNLSDKSEQEKISNEKENENPEKSK